VSKELVFFLMPFTDKPSVATATFIAAVGHEVDMVKVKSIFGVDALL